MNQKICSMCKRSLAFSAFNKARNHPDGIYPTCRDCRGSSRRNSPYEIAIKEASRKRIQERKDAKKVRQVELDTANLKRCSRCALLKDKSLYSRAKNRLDGLYAYCSPCGREIESTPEAKAVREAHRRDPETKKKERLHRLARGISAEEREKRKAARRAPTAKAARNTQRRRKWKTDPQYRLRELIRSRIYKAVKRVNAGAKGGGSAVCDLGCTIAEFKEHIERLWRPGMNWANHGRGRGKWQIDHIVALVLFDLTSPGQFHKAAHYKNQQPLWHEEHVKKSAQDRKLNAEKEKGCPGKTRAAFRLAKRANYYRCFTLPIPQQ